MDTIQQADDVFQGFIQAHGEPKSVSEIVRKGGPGSGFHNHEGRPGEVGGSSSDGGGASEKPTGGAGGEASGGRDYKEMSLSGLAREVRRDWGSKVNFAAKPYLEALSSLENISDQYGADSGQSIVAYFLSNASSWRGETAKAVKAELNRRLKG